MENLNISTTKELRWRIMQLKEEKVMHEENLKRSFNDFKTSLNPVTIVKDSIHKLAEDNEVKYDLAKVGLTIASNFIIDTILGKHKSIKGFLSSVLVENISNAIIDKKLSDLK